MQPKIIEFCEIVFEIFQSFIVVKFILNIPNKVNSNIVIVITTKTMYLLSNMEIKNNAIFNVTI